MDITTLLRIFIQEMGGPGFSLFYWISELEELDKIHWDAHPEFFHKTQNVFRTKQHFENLLKDSSTLLLGAFDGPNLLGLVQAIVKEQLLTDIHVARKYILLDNLVVRENSKRNGIGKMLYGGVKSWAKNNQINEIQLKVYNFNSGAIAFYRYLGFTEFNVSMRATLSWAIAEEVRKLPDCAIIDLNKSRTLRAFIIKLELALTLIEFFETSDKL